MIPTNLWKNPQSLPPPKAKTNLSPSKLQSAWLIFWTNSSLNKYPSLPLLLLPSTSAREDLCRKRIKPSKDLQVTIRKYPPPNLLTLSLLKRIMKGGGSLLMRESNESIRTLQTPRESWPFSTFSRWRKAAEWPSPKKWPNWLSRSMEKKITSMLKIASRSIIEGVAIRVHPGLLKKKKDESIFIKGFVYLYININWKQIHLSWC